MNTSVKTFCKSELFFIVRHGQLFEHVDYLSRPAKLETSKLQDFGRKSAVVVFSFLMAIQRDLHCLTRDITAPAHRIIVLGKKGDDIRNGDCRIGRRSANIAQTEDRALRVRTTIYCVLLRTHARRADVVSSLFCSTYLSPQNHSPTKPVCG